MSVIYLFLACAAVVQAKNYVVCVGIADYPGESEDLLLSATDAMTMKELYEKNGDAEVKLLVNEQATANAVVQAAYEVFEQARSTDVIVFFFSGHGLPGSFICYDGKLKYETLTAIMSRSMANSKMVFADACFSGEARQEDTDTEEQRHKAENVMFFLSSRSGETSIERRFGWKNSLFTAYLERGLRGGADINSDRTVTARELFLFVNQGVAKQSKNKQHPVMWGRFDDDMPVMIWRKSKK